MKKTTMVAITKTKEFAKLWDKKIKLYNALVLDMESMGMSPKKLADVVEATEMVERLFIGGVATKV